MSNSKAYQLQQAYIKLEKAYKAYAEEHYTYKHVEITDNLEDAIEALKDAVKDCER